MSRSTISQFQLTERFPNAEAARIYLERQLWPDGPVCPTCKVTEGVKARKGRVGVYHCNGCKLDFTVRSGTIFGKSHVPLHIWMHAIYALIVARKGVSSMQLAKEIGVRQGTAWFMLQRLREACGSRGAMLQGTVEVDETFIGGEENNRHMYDRIHKPRERSEKTIVVGIRQRGGNTIAKVVQSTGGLALRGVIRDNVKAGSRVMSDEYASYTSLPKEGFEHDSVKHIVGEYVRGDVHTNGIESVWAVLNRGMHGTFHHISKKHTQRYVDEFAFRLSEGKVQRHVLDRLDSFVHNVTDRRITYNQLTAKAAQ